MCKRGFLFVVVMMLISVSELFAEKVYKEIVIDGEKVNKWMEITQIEEYDQQGRVTNRTKPYSFGYEEEYIEYKGNCVYTTKKTDFYGEKDEYKTLEERDKSNRTIHYKSENIKNGEVGMESWFEYNSKKNYANYAMFASNGGKETWEEWWNFDGNGNPISSKNSIGSSSVYRYERNNKVYSKEESRFGVIEYWFSYDEKNQIIYQKCMATMKSQGKWADEGEKWFEYNAKNDITHKKVKSTDGKISNTYYAYDYVYHPNGKLKKKTTYSCEVE